MAKLDNRLEIETILLFQADARVNALASGSLEARHHRRGQPLVTAMAKTEASLKDVFNKAARRRPTTAGLLVVVS